LVVSLIAQLAWPTREPPAKVHPNMAVSPAASVIAPASDYSQILARPLFNPARGAAGAAGAEQAASTSLSDYTLVGLAMVGGRGEAVFRGPAGEVLSLRTGEALLGWRIVAISPAGAVLGQGDIRRMVPVSTSAAAKTGAP
jgi:hypothetical protein